MKFSLEISIWKVELLGDLFLSFLFRFSEFFLSLDSFFHSSIFLILLKDK